MASSWASSEAETEAIAAALVRALQPGAVVYVRGPLGAGKTVFVRGAARALGARDQVTSPTFTVANLYGGERGPVAHLDLYRAERLTEEEWGDLEAYFDGPLAAFVEWPEAGAGVLPTADVDVVITVEPDGRRRIDVGPVEPRAQASYTDPS
jgi:tRNA threonylcarbamoyladenosine biosynthesis protein TsaE